MRWLSELKFARDKRGVTLIELTIALAIFGVAVVIAVNSFLNVLTVSRESVQRQTMQDHAEFLFSLMSKEIRTAKVNYGDLPAQACDNFFGPGGEVADNQIYKVIAGSGVGNPDELRFMNYKNDCVRYFLEADSANNNIKRLKVERRSGGVTKSAWVTPLGVTVNDLKFTATDMVKDRASTYQNHPASVSYSMELDSVIWNPQNLKYSNFVTARNFEQF